MSKEPAIRVIGMGNPLRHDDSVGVRVARRLAVRIQPHVEVRVHSGGGLGLMDAWQGASAAVVVDAVSSGAPPGTVSRFDVRARPLPEQLGAPRSTHDFGLGESLELARAMRRLPDRLIVIGIEGGDFSVGGGLSGPVEEALERAVDAVLQEIDLMTGGLRGGGAHA